MIDGNKKKQLFFVKSMSIVIGLTIISKLLGFVKQMVLAATYGTTLETDLINLAQGLIGNVQYVIEQVLITAFTSVYVYIKGDTKKATAFSVKVGVLFTIFASGISLMIFIIAPFLVRLIAPGYSVEAKQVLAEYLCFLSPLLICFVWIAVFHALLNANHKFIVGECIGLNQSIIVISMVWLFKDKLGVSIINFSFVIYSIFNVIFLGIASRKYWKCEFSGRLLIPEIKKLLAMMGSLLIGYSVIYINQQVDKILVSKMEEGTVTALGYAAVLSNLVGTLIVTISSMVFSYINNFIVQKQKKKVTAIIENIMLLSIIILLPISMVSILCAKDIVSVVFERGNFNSSSVKIAAAALAGYGFSFIPLSMREILSRVQYGYQESKYPMINSTISIIVNIILSVLLSRKFGVFGVTVASSIALLVAGVLNMCSVKKRNLDINIHSLIKYIPILLLGCGACFVIIKYLSNYCCAMSSMKRLCTIIAGTLGLYFLLLGSFIYKIVKNIDQYELRKS